MNSRVGIGYDVHQLQNGERLILGGVEIPSPKGTVGYSDGDVLYHAVADALLGAAALGDLGEHFSSSDPEYEDIDSGVILKEVRSLLDIRGYTVDNIDSTIILQSPKIAGYLKEMRRNMVHLLHVKESGDVSVKVTSTDRLGFIGREEGIAALAIAQLRND